MAILGKSQDDYQKYREQIREEYSLYPFIMYNSKRKKALFHFLQMNTLFLTEHYFKKHEPQRLQNLITNYKKVKVELTNTMIRCYVASK